MTQQDLSMTGRGTGATALPHNFICELRVSGNTWTTETAFSRMGTPQEGGADASGQHWEHSPEHWYHAAIRHTQALGNFPIPGHRSTSLEPRSSAHLWGVQRAVVPWDCSPSV